MTKAPLTSKPETAPKGTITTLTAVIAAAILTALLGLPGGKYQADSDYYRYLAQGQFSKVIQPFASRGLEPAIVHLVDNIFRIPPDVGFAILAILSLIVCLITPISIASLSARTYWIVAILFMPVWTTLFHAYLLPDIFHCSLVAIFCLCLKKHRYWEAALMFIPLYATRESTALVLLIFLVASVGRLKLRILATAIACNVVGYGLEKWLVAGTGGNRHQISQLAYLVGKVPYNILKNIFGVPFWSPTFEVPCTPTHIYILPHWRIFGAISAIGPCRWEPSLQANTLLLWIGTFGILPAALLAVSRGKWREIWKGEVFVRFCVLYGTIAYVIGPALGTSGTSVHRLVAYGWLAFALALPTISPRMFENRRSLLATHLIVGWLTWAVFWKMNSPLGTALAITVGTAGWLFAASSLRENPKTTRGRDNLTEEKISIAD